jgi:hypothetical protein
LEVREESKQDWSFYYRHHHHWNFIKSFAKIRAGITIGTSSVFEVLGEEGK